MQQQLECTGGLTMKIDAATAIARILKQEGVEWVCLQNE
jgi:hypothetical protein